MCNLNFSLTTIRTHNMNARKIRKVSCHYSTVSLFPLIFPKRRERAVHIESECDETFSISFALRVHFCRFLLWKNIFYVTVNKWDVAEAILTSRQPGLQIKVYDYRCAYWISCAVCCCWCFPSPAAPECFNRWISHQLNGKTEVFWVMALARVKCGKLLPCAINFLLYFQINEPRIIWFPCWSIRFKHIT